MKVLRHLASSVIEHIGMYLDVQRDMVSDAYVAMDRVLDTVHGAIAE